ncbi:MAG: dihydrofolate reductase [Candidatus Hepatoplasma vulgare]|nr:MAG: dihydrofolate reductase [Candidatus Hepatoplasma sp.]
MLKLIVAYDKNMLIGSGNKMPWYFIDELKHFKSEIKNQILVVGENTFYSFKKIPNEKIILLSNNKSLLNKYKNLEIETDIEKIVNRSKNEDIIVLGGRNVYLQFLPFVDLMIISIIEKEFKGDVYFPKWDNNDFLLIKTKKINTFINAYYFKRK